MSIRERYQSTSYQPEVLFSREWHDSGNRFATEVEAGLFLQELVSTWNPQGFIRDVCVVRIKQPPNAVLNPETRQAVTLAVEDADADYRNKPDVLDDDDGEEGDALQQRQWENREALFRRRVEELEAQTGQRKEAWYEERKVYDRSDLAVEKRQSLPLAQVREAYFESLRELKRARTEFEQEVAWIEAQAVKAEAEEQRLIRQAPPSLQDLVLAYGTHDKITAEAWVKFNADMAEWKAKMRAGEFDAKIW